MRRLGRYPLAVMAWVAVYAGWSSVLGLVVAAITGETLDEGDRVAPTVGLGVSTVFTIVLPLVPTLVTLWFNDWLRDGAPSRADRERGRRQAPASPPNSSPEPAAAPRAQAAPRVPVVETSAVTTPSLPTDGAVAQPGPALGGSVRVVLPGPLGVPEVAAEASPRGPFPVARLLRATDTAPESPVAPARSSIADGVPVIDPADPLGVGDLDLSGRERR